MQFIAPYRVINVGNFESCFHALHLADLRGSGLTDETILNAGLYSLAPKHLDLFFKNVPIKLQTALCFPYQGGDFARVKLFPALGKMKYAQPPRTNARLYMPFPIDDRELIVAEGEKKTLAAFQAGLNVVGIGGVWNWLSHGQPIDDLNLIEWDGRDVTIIPDSDVFNRSDLLRAIFALGCEVRSQGASVLIAEIPQPTGAKIGLDDFLFAGRKVDDLAVFGLGHSRFKGARWWHGRWKVKKLMEAA